MKYVKYADKRNISALSFQSGLSLIELLVVLVIISILFGVGFMNYRDYARKQSVSAAARQVESDIRLARQMAFEGKKPDGCGDAVSLDGYIFRVNADNTYDIIARCNPGNIDIFIKDNVSLPSSNLTLESANYNVIMFKSVGDGVIIPIPTTPPIPDTNITITITQEVTDYDAILDVGTNITLTPP